MRLIGAVKRLEAGAAARAEEPVAVGVVWSTHEETVDPADLEPGEYVALDVWIEGGPGSGVVDAETSTPALQPVWWRVRERITLDPQDLGVVRNAEGMRIGMVLELDGSMVTLEMDESSAA